MMESYWPTWVEINLDNIAYNTKQIKNRVGDSVDIMAVVKGDAYGHGILEVSSVVLENGATKLGIASIDEGIYLRDNGIEAPILILNPILKDSIKAALKYNLMLTVFTIELAKSISEEATKQYKTAKVNIKINTGMNRFGVDPDLALSLVKEIIVLPNIFIEGIFTHLATSYVEEDNSIKQFSIFTSVIDELEGEGINIPYKHCCNTGGILNFSHMYLNQVRPGVLITTPQTALRDDNNMDIRESFELKSKVVFIRNVKGGQSIGYNQLYKANNDTNIAIVSAGWGDGIPRELSNKGYVLIKGQRCPMVGRIGCDQVLVEVNGIKDIDIGEEVVFIGRQGNEVINCWEWGQILGGVSSPITLRSLITNRVKKLYIRNIG